FVLCDDADLHQLAVRAEGDFRWSLPRPCKGGRQPQPQHRARHWSKTITELSVGQAVSPAIRTLLPHPLRMTVRIQTTPAILRPPLILCAFGWQVRIAFARADNR